MLINKLTLYLLSLSIGFVGKVGKSEFGCDVVPFVGADPNRLLIELEF